MTGAALDPSKLVGTWTNADRKTVCLGQAHIGQRSGALVISGVPALGGVSEVPAMPATGYLAREDGAAFEAISAQGSYQNERIRLEGNLNAGLLVLSCYTQFEDRDAGGFFAREYFSKGDRPYSPLTDASQLNAANPLFFGLAKPEQPSTANLQGQWRNADGAAASVEELSIEANEAGLQVSARARHSDDWGETHAMHCTDVVHGTVAGIAANARFDLETAAVNMQIRETKGVLVAAIYTRFADERPALFNRDFFFRR